MWFWEDVANLGVLAFAIILILIMWIGMERLLDFWTALPNLWKNVPTALSGKDVFFGLSWTMIYLLSYGFFYLQFGMHFVVMAFFLLIYMKHH